MSIKIDFAIPEGYYGKIFPRSGLLKNRFITCDAGVIDSDFRGHITVMLINQSDNIFTVRHGDKIAQMVFMKKYKAEFIPVSELCDLGVTKRGCDGFGSSGCVSVIKKVKSEEDDLKISEENAYMSVNRQKVIDETIKYD